MLALLRLVGKLVIDVPVSEAVVKLDAGGQAAVIEGGDFFAEHGILTDHAIQKVAICVKYSNDMIGCGR